MLARLRKAVLPLALAGVSLYIVACEVDSADQFIRDVPVDFTGFYANSGARIVSQNTGKPITSLNLIQNGDRLEGVDNNGSIWRGSLGEVQDGRSQFRLDGRTTTGTDATWSGTLSTDDAGNTGTNGGTTTSAQGTMNGTYVEPSFFATIRAQATIPGSSSGGGDGGSGSLQVTASPSTITTSNGTATLTASGGSSSYDWEAPAAGSLSAFSGPTVEFRRNNAVDQVVVVRVRSGSRNGQVSITLE